MSRRTAEAIFQSAAVHSHRKPPHSMLRLAPAPLDRHQQGFDFHDLSKSKAAPNLHLHQVLSAVLQAKHCVHRLVQLNWMTNKVWFNKQDLSKSEAASVCTHITSFCCLRLATGPLASLVVWMQAGPAELAVQQVLLLQQAGSEQAGGCLHQYLKRSDLAPIAKLCACAGWSSSTG